MLPYQIIAGGSFTSSATVAKQVVQVSDQPDLIWVRNRTAWGDDADEVSVESWWRRGMAQGAAQTTDQAVTSGILSSEAVSSDGFRVYNTVNPPTFAALATTGTDINKTTFVVGLSGDTGSIQVGDVVRTYNNVGMFQISGYDHTVTAVSADTSITLGNMVVAGPFAADSTSGFVQQIIPNRMYPRWRYVAFISQASQCVVSTTVDNDFTVGEVVSLRVPSAFGMDEINNLQGIVQSVSAASVTLDIDTSGFTAFAFPTSAVAAAGVSPAVIVPVGAGPYPNANPPYVPTNAAFDNRNLWVIEMGSNIVTSTSSVYDWVAFKYDVFTAQ